MDSDRKWAIVLLATCVVLFVYVSTTHGPERSTAVSRDASASASAAGAGASTMVVTTPLKGETDRLHSEISALKAQIARLNDVELSAAAAAPAECPPPPKCEPSKAVSTVSRTANTAYGTCEKYFPASKPFVPHESIGATLHAYPFGVGSVWTHDDQAFWSSINGNGPSGWERGTFEIFKRLITPETVVMDFGSWCGPTALFAALLGRYVYSMECDPYAKVKLDFNLQLNAPLHQRMETHSWCISDSAKTDKMTGNGGSGSRLHAVDGITPSSADLREWTVRCITLPTFVEFHVKPEHQPRSVAAQAAHPTLPRPPPIFVKVDTEGAEAVIIPQLYDWLASDKFGPDYSLPDGNPKPTFFISMHNQFSHISAEQSAKFVRVVHLYKYVALGNEAYRDAKTMTAAELQGCTQCDIVLADNAI